MFFIYLFFGIGVLTTILMMLPALLNVYVFIATLFATLTEERANAVEERKQALKNKHEKKMAKLGKKEEVKEEVVADEVKEEVAPYNYEVKENDGYDYPKSF